MIKLANLLTEQRIGFIDTSNIPINQELKALDAEVSSYVKDKFDKGHSGCQDAVKFACGLSGMQKFKLTARYSELSSGQDFLDAHKAITDKLKTMGPESLGAAENLFLKYVDGHKWSLKPVDAGNLKKLVKIFKTIVQFAPEIPWSDDSLTGGDDFYHRAYGKSGAGWHDDSIAIDIVFPFNESNMEKVERIILHLMAEYPSLGFINEVAGYGKHSGKATGNHFHISLARGAREAARFALLKDPATGRRKKSKTTDEAKLAALRAYNKLEPTTVDSDYATKYAEVTSAKIQKGGRIDINYPMAHLARNLGIRFELLYYPDPDDLKSFTSSTIAIKPRKIKFRGTHSYINFDMSNKYGKPNYGTSGYITLGRFATDLKDGVYQYIMTPINIDDKSVIGTETITEKFIIQDNQIIDYTTKKATKSVTKPDLQIGPTSRNIPDVSGTIDQIGQ